MKSFWLDCVLATIFVFLVMLGVERLSESRIFDALDPVSQALADFELTDYAFSSLRIEDPLADSNILIVNTANLSRAEIAQQIRVLSQFQPRLFAIDIIFSCDGGLTDPENCPQRYDTLGNLILRDAIENAGVVVMAHKLWQTKTTSKLNIAVYDSMEHSDEILRPSNVFEGFVNLPTGADHQEDLKICRSVYPTVDVDNETQIAFSVRAAQMFDSVKVKKFLERDSEEESINYKGNIVDPYGASTYPGRYAVLDWYQALDPTSFEPSVVKNKIVLMGFLGADLRDTSWDDKFFTPLNKKVGGRARPDMYGVVVHANIISMILSGDFVGELELWQQIAIAIILCFVNIVLFAYIHRRFPIWFDTVSLGIQLIQILFFLILVPYVFYWFTFKLEITIALLALALAGPCFEIYISILKNGAKFVINRFLLTKREEEVLSH